MLDNLLVASAETSSRAERARKRTNDHVYFGGIDVLRFGYATAGAAKDAVGPGFVEDETEFVLEFEFDLDSC
jgi:hypothetical protein